jgi:hypothetical protein
LLRQVNVIFASIGYNGFVYDFVACFSNKVSK